MAMAKDFTIGRLAKSAGVNVQTVRYYERRRLLEPALRRDSGYRVYQEDAVQKLRFIKNAQALGFTLNEISGLLRLRVSQRARCQNVRKKADAKLKDVEQKIQTLNAMKRVLKELVTTCHKKGTTDQCPILKSMEGQNK